MTLILTYYVFIIIFSDSERLWLLFALVGIFEELSVT